MPNIALLGWQGCYGSCQLVIIDMHPVIKNAKGLFLHKIDVTGRKLFHDFNRQIRKADLTISLPCQLVEVIPRFIPQYLFAERIKGVLDMFFVRMRFHFLTSLRVRKGG